MKALVDGVAKFRAEVYPTKESKFRELESGQKPATLFITCSDSRIDPSLITQTEPGELFVIRSAGNLVPRYGVDPSSESATIEFAVNGLGVRHVVVCGHSQCGAMGAVLEPEKAAALPEILSWLEKAGPKKLEGDGATLLRQITANVLEQLDNLRTHPAVAAAVDRGELELHGWYYDFGAGSVHRVTPAGDLAALESTVAG